jgi:hypothetical protein
MGGNSDRPSPNSGSQPPGAWPDESGSNGTGSRERRQSARHLACVPAHIHKDEKKADLALIQDVSVTGALLFTRAGFDIGHKIDLSLYIREGEPRSVKAQVVRSERRREGVLWPYLVAVQFDEPLSDLEAEIAALAKHQAMLRS